MTCWDYNPEEDEWEHPDGYSVCDILQHQLGRKSRIKWMARQADGTALIGENGPVLFDTMHEAMAAVSPDVEHPAVRLAAGQ